MLKLCLFVFMYCMFCFGLFPFVVVSNCRCHLHTCVTASISSPSSHVALPETLVQTPPVPTRRKTTSSCTGDRTSGENRGFAPIRLAGGSIQLQQGRPALNTAVDFKRFKIKHGDKLVGVDDSITWEEIAPFDEDPTSHHKGVALLCR